MKNRKLALIAGIIAAILVALAVLTALPVRVRPVALEPTFCTPLAVWWGEVQTITEKDCAAWQSSFNCELRRGGDAGLVASQILTTTCEATVDVPGTGQCGNAVDVCWDTTALDIGDYEVFGRLEQTNGVETWYGGLKDVEGHDGDMFFLVDKFTVGQVCNVPGQFVIVQ
jgi:hypothetical protein